MKNKRVKLAKYDEFFLFTEVEGYCPLCPKSLIYKKNIHRGRNFEIAHIFPLNATTEELQILKNVEILNSDLNHEENLICLCNECHNKFDNPRTLEEYNNLLEIKKKLINNNKSKNLWENTEIDNQIEEIIFFLSNQEFEDEPLNYLPKKVNDKINESITILKKRSINRNVDEYYYRIKNKFIEIEKLNPGSTDIIASQIKIHYMKLYKIYGDNNQIEIFNQMSDWLCKMTKNSSIETSEIIVSYFIQNCEIFK